MKQVLLVDYVSRRVCSCVKTQGFFSVYMYGIGMPKTTNTSVDPCVQRVIYLKAERSMIFKPNVEP